MSRYALPCIACGRQLENVTADAGNQPYAGTAFVTHGHYGSTAYDPIDGRYLELNICDLCLVSHHDRVIEGRDWRPVIDGGVTVDTEKCDWKTVPWTPTKEEIDHVIETARKEHEIDDPLLTPTTHNTYTTPPADETAPEDTSQTQPERG